MIIYLIKLNLNYVVNSYNKHITTNFFAKTLDYYILYYIFVYVL